MSGLMSRTPGQFIRRLIAVFLLLLATLVMAPQGAMAETVCYKTGTELDFDKADMQNTRAKLTNPFYFGPGGTVASETLTFSTLGNVSEANLIGAGCDIYIGGGYEGTELTATEANGLLTWATGPRDVMVIGGCDNPTNRVCTVFGRTLTASINGGVTLNGTLAYNPANCGGAGGINTFGGASTGIGLGPNGTDTVLATNNSDGSPAITLDEPNEPRILFTADADMFGSNGSGAIGAGATATTNQAIFVLNAFKFALDDIADRLDNPQCFESYDDTADLSLTVSASDTTLTIGGITTITVTVINNEPLAGETPNNVEATIPVPAGMSFVPLSTVASQGTYNDATGVWTIGTLAANTSVTLTYQLAATTGGAPTLLGEITNSSLPDPDSAPNASFAEDDLADTLADDDEDQVTFSVPEPFACDGTLYQIATSNSTLKRLNFVASGNGYDANLTNIASAGQQINAGWGYNEVDNLIYGVKSGSRELWRIDANGVFTLITTLNATFQNGGNAGDILPNGTMVYKRNNSTWQLMDLAVPSAPVNLGTIALTPSVNAVDFAHNPADGLIYGIDGSTDRLFYIDISGGAGAATPVFFGPTIYTGGYGATWFDEDGRLYAYDNGTNEISVINVGTTGNGTGDRTLLSVSTNDEGGINDGAYCRGPAPVPLGAISGTVYVDQNGSDARDGGDTDLGADILVSLYYDNATPLNTTDDRFIGTTETEADGTYFFDGLVTIETYRVEVDVNDADLPSGSTIGTSNPIVDVVVTANTTTTDQDFGFDPGTADLSITKTANVTSAQAGDTVVWTISVSNAGTGSPSGVKVLDLIPNGFDYVSDDAPATGDIYDPGQGIWFVDEILVGATETLNITTTARASGSDTNHAEIISNSLPDPDSDADRGRLVDDLDDGLADDDEASFTVTLGAGLSVLSGRVFIDNGAGGATAQNAVLEPSETGSPNASIALYDSGGGLIAMPPVGGDGTWSYTLPTGFTAPVTVTATPLPGWLTISEQTTGLPTLTDADPHDGTYTFTPASGVSYSTLDFGLIEEPRLTQNQSVGIAGGQVVLLPHVYTATTAATVTFSYADVVMSPADAFSATLFEDTNCDGTPDVAISAPRAVIAGDSVCIVSRVVASSGVGPGAQLSYGLTALTAFDATTKSATARNDDVITASIGGNELVLQKTVRNETKATLEGTSNVGDLGDVLEYRLTMSNPSGQPAINVTVKDRTPAYTSLTAPITTPVSVAPGVTCNLSVPAANVAGYAGPLEWNCPGNFPPGEQGSLTFRVTISP